MFSRIKKFCQTNNKAVIISSLITIGGIAVYQGQMARSNYLKSHKLETPHGSKGGFIKWATEIVDIISDGESNADKGVRPKASIFHLFGHHTETSETDGIARFGEQNGSSARLIKRQPRKKIKLMILGDSLVCGIGCDALNQSPVLPSVIATELSTRNRVDVEWHSVGIIGGTAKDIRELILPDIKLRLKECTTQPDHIVVFIIICGVNDWKCLFEKFPRGLGPSSFRQELEKLVDEIKSINIEAKCPTKIYLPNLPITCILSDSTSSISVWPLSDLVRYISYVWDQQKEAISFADKKVQ